MLNNLESQEYFIYRIYQGNKQIWQVPTIMVAGLRFFNGITLLSFTTYPEKCEVTVNINGKVTVGKSNTLGIFQLSLPEPIKTGDYLILTIKKAGWKKHNSILAV